MSSHHSQRIPKTIHRKLQDLDDHLYLLGIALGGFVIGDVAHIKSLAAELRVLICYSSGTEGLLWRVANELGVDDSVYVHLAGNVNRNHSLSEGLDFAFVPIFRGGTGDPRLIPNHYSFNHIIKNCEGVFVSGQGYTHEQLIKAVSQQIGSAHEDEGIEPYLVELGKILLANKQPLCEVLMSDSEFTLEIGARVLERASTSLKFTRKPRADYFVQKQATTQVPRLEFEDFDDSSFSLPNEGTLLFMIDLPDKNWAYDDQEYSIGQIRKDPVRIVPAKHADGTLELEIVGLHENSLKMRGPIPKTNNPGVTIILTWSLSEIVLYINGQRADSFCVQ